MHERLVGNNLNLRVEEFQYQWIACVHATYKINLHELAHELFDLNYDYSKPLPAKIDYEDFEVDGYKSTKRVELVVYVTLTQKDINEPDKNTVLNRFKKNLEKKGYLDVEVEVTNVERDTIH